MPLDPGAGHIAPPAKLIDPAKLERAFYDEHPDPSQPGERVVFGTSGHRGSAFRRTFNEDHIAAITSAICDWRQANKVDGPLFLGVDTHALSDPARNIALEVLAQRGVHVLRASAGAFTPTPAVSRAIIVHNRGKGPRADGIVVTPSHNPPEDGGFKYNPPHGGPAEGEITSWIERRANELLVQGARSIPRTPIDSGVRSGIIAEYDFIGRYIDDLSQAIDMEAIAREKPKLGVDPMGGASVEYWGRIADRYGLDLTVINKTVDKTFSFVPMDHDGKIRTDCSSPYPMAGLLAIKDRFEVAWGNDGDADRHGIVTPGTGLLQPNHYLCAAVDYLLRHRPKWPAKAAVGKTAVTSGMLERVAQAHGRAILEVPVGFKWYVPGLHDGSLVFGGEESAGASFLARDGATWTTDKDGILLGLLAAEIVAVAKTDPGALYASLEGQLGTSYYERRDAPADDRIRERLKRLTPDDWTLMELAGDPVTSRRTSASGGGALGGLKVSTAQGWFAVRPSGTEAVYKLYAESFRSADHLKRIFAEATELLEKLE